VSDFDNIEKAISDLLGKDIKEGSLQTVATKGFIDYSISVVVGRALPDIRDGLKPVQRRILQSLKDLNLTPMGSPKKSARITGLAIGVYHPHGDTSVYDAMVAMSQDWKKMIPLVIGQGNMGSIDGDNQAAMRYTEAKFSKAGAKFFQDIEYKVVDKKPNYDDTEEEYEVLPVPFPNLLINGGQGIASGMACSIPTHNPKEILEALIYAVNQIKKKKPIDPNELLKIIPAPDLPTGGIIYNTGDMLNVIKTGRGGVSLRARHIIEKKRSREVIVVTEIPYNINKTKLVKEIATVVREKNIDGVYTIRDESNREGIRIVIELKSGANSGVIWSQLVKSTSLDISIKYNLVLVKDNKPIDANFINILESFVSFRKEIIYRKYNTILADSLLKIEILEGLLKALEKDNLDKIIDIIRLSKTQDEASEKLIKDFSFTERQVKAILEIRLSKLVGLEREKLEISLKEVKEIKSKAEKIINRDNEQYKVILQETRALLRDKDFSKERKSTIDNTLSSMDIEDLIPQENCVIYLTQRGYLKRVSEKNLKRQNKNTRGSKAIEIDKDDNILKTFKTHSHSDLLFMTEKGQAYMLKAYKIPEHKKFIANILDIDKDDKLLRVIELDQLEDRTILLGTKNGLIKQTKIEDFSSSTRKSGVTAIKLKEGDTVSVAKLVKEEKYVSLINKEGKIITFELSSIPVTGRNTMGVVGMKGDNLEVIGGDIFTEMDKAILITVTKSGKTKMSKMSEYKVQNRAGKGLTAMRVTKTTGELVKAVIVDIKEKERDLILIFTTKKGISNKIPLKITPQKRATMGIKSVSLDKDDYVVDAILTEKEIAN